MGNALMIWYDEAVRKTEGYKELRSSEKLWIHLYDYCKKK